MSEKQLTVKYGNTQVLANGGSITVPPNTPITLIPDPIEGPPELFDGANRLNIPLASGAWTLTGNRVEGNFSAKWGDDAKSKSVSVTVHRDAPVTKPAQGTRTDPNASATTATTPVAEVERGEYDRVFAIVVWCVFLVLSVLLVWTLWRFIGPRAISAPSAPGTLEAGQGQIYALQVQAYEWQVRTVVILVAVAIGGLMLLAGAALAALEVRGRLTVRAVAAPAAGGEAADDERGGQLLPTQTIKELFEGAATVIQNAKVARGTALVILAGVAIVISSLVFVSCDTAAEVVPNPTPTATSTTSPSPSPTATTSPSPSAPAAPAP